MLLQVHVPNSALPLVYILTFDLFQLVLLSMSIYTNSVQMWLQNYTFLIMILYSSSDIVTLVHFRHVTPNYAAWCSPLRFFSNFFAPFILLLGRLFFWSAVSRGLLFSHPFIGFLDPTNWPSGE